MACQTSRVKSFRLVPMVLIALAVTGCGSDADDDPGLRFDVVDASRRPRRRRWPPVTTTTTPVTTAASTSTSTSTTSTTSSTTTSTTLAPGAELVLRPNGLGDAAFGADPEGVVAYVSSIIGKPTVDTGWVDPLSVGACPGTELRQVFWADLVLQFSDQSSVTSGRRHFFSYVYGPELRRVDRPCRFEDRRRHRRRFDGCRADRHLSAVPRSIPATTSAGRTSSSTTVSPDSSPVSIQPIR